MGAPNGEKGVVWTKIVYHRLCIINTDNEQEGISDIIEGRNKNKMLCACEEKAVFITRVTRIFEYNLKCVITQIGRSEKEK